MKNLCYLMLLLATTSLAQVKGNGEIVTQNFPLEKITAVSIQMYAKVTIDPSAEPGMTITGESNLLPQIGKEVINGTLTLDQLKWIQPSQDIIIKIGAPALEKVIHGTHDQTYVINLNQKQIAIDAQIGDVILTGKVDTLKIHAKLGKVNASGLIAQNARVAITSRGSATVNVTNTLETKLDEDARLELFSKPETITGNYKPKAKPIINENLVYVSFKLKNNSWNRNNFYVVGPNPDGSSFSYGFAIMPGLARNERWSEGTRIYLDKRLGKRELLYTVKAEDEGSTVKLFE